VIRAIKAWLSPSLDVYYLGGFFRIEVENLCGMMTGMKMSADKNHDLIVSMQAVYIEWKRGMLDE